MKKQQQLGMNPSTASGRLVKDLLFNFVKETGQTCFHCKKPMTREDFSIEHKTPWLDSEDPRKMYFSLDNIAYSHLACNSKAARRTTKKWESEEERKMLAADVERKRWQNLPKETQQKIRREKYLKNGN